MLPGKETCVSSPDPYPPHYYYDIDFVLNYQKKVKKRKNDAKTFSLVQLT
jgi:hypothetical protein